MSSQQAALDVFRAVTAFSERQPESGEFISSKWEGARPGYAFKLGQSGLGYYVDPVSAASPAEAAAPSAAAAAPAPQRDANEMLEVRMPRVHAVIL